MSTIKTGTTLTTAYQVVGDTTGSFVVQTGSTPTTAMTIDTSQNVGIGTSSPGYKLDVRNTANSSIACVTSGSTSIAQVHAIGTAGATSYFWQASSSYATYHSLVAGNAGIYANTNLSYEVDGALYQSWWTNGNERMRIDSSGNLGVGITPSGWGGGNTALQMAGPSMWGASGVSHWSTNTYFDGTNYKYIASNYVTDYYQLNGAHVWRTAASGTAGANVSALNESMRIASSGNVGIGTNDPLVSLHTYSSNAGTPATSGSTTTGVSARFQNVSVNFDIGTYGAGACFIQPRLVGNNATNFDLVLQPNGGGLFVGTPTGNGKVNIYNAANSYIEVASNGRVAGTTSMMFGQDINGTGYVWNRENQAVIFGTNNTTRMTLSNTGNLQFNTSNAGIIFSKSGALNNSTLNDYEEGSWTPVSGSGNITVTSIYSARYVKIGNLVHVSCYLNVTNSTGSVSSWNCAGLPFAMYNGTYGSATRYYGPNSFTASIYVESGASYIIDNSGLATGANGIMLSATYMTN